MKVLVIGENSKDIWVYGDVTRINPEAPTPVFIEKYRKENDGMAANCTIHLKHLNIDYDFITQVEPITKTRYVDEKSNYILMQS